MALEAGMSSVTKFARNPKCPGNISASAGIGTAGRLRRLPVASAILRKGIPSQVCASPPSTATSLAVMKLLSDEARKAAAAPISAGSAMRWSGFIEAKAFKRS